LHGELAQSFLAAILISAASAGLVASVPSPVISAARPAATPAIPRTRLAVLIISRLSFAAALSICSRLILGSSFVLAGLVASVAAAVISAAASAPPSVSISSLAVLVVTRLRLIAALRILAWLALTGHLSLAAAPAASGVLSVLLRVLVVSGLSATLTICVRLLLAGTRATPGACATLPLSLTGIILGVFAVALAFAPSIPPILLGILPASRLLPAAVGVSGRGARNFVRATTTVSILICRTATIPRLALA
jgi:hypothetical protein